MVDACVKIPDHNIHAFHLSFVDRVCLCLCCGTMTIVGPKARCSSLVSGHWRFFVVPPAPSPPSSPFTAHSPFPPPSGPKYTPDLPSLSRPPDALSAAHRASSPANTPPVICRTFTVHRFTRIKVTPDSPVHLSLFPVGSLLSLCSYLTQSPFGLWSELLENKSLNSWCFFTCLPLSPEQVFLRWHL